MTMLLSQPRACRGLPTLTLTPRRHETGIRPRHIEIRLISTIRQRVFKNSYYEPPSRAHFYTNRHAPTKNITLSLTFCNIPTQRSCLLQVTQMLGSQLRSHGTHSHHHHSNVYLTSMNKSDPGVRITRIGLLVNICMAIGKGIGGYAFHSQALVADAYHALVDLVSDFMTLATVSWSLKGPSKKFPAGYGKVESLGALGVSGLLLCGGVLMGLNAAEVLVTRFFPDIAEAVAQLGDLGHGGSHLHGHSHGAEMIGPGINAAWLAAGSVVVKEWLYRASK